MIDFTDKDTVLKLEQYQQQLLHVNDILNRIKNVLTGTKLNENPYTLPGLLEQQKSLLDRHWQGLQKTVTRERSQLEMAGH